ncbi:MAG: hypothetical protein ABG776_18680 [Cyanobacteria bacterium J06555_13]
MLRSIAIAYDQIDDPDIASRGLGVVVDQFEEMPRLGQSTPYLTAGITESYGKISAPSAANEGLLRLWPIVLDHLKVPAPDTYNRAPYYRRNLVTILGQIAKAYGQQGYIESAQDVLEQAQQRLSKNDFAYRP